MVTKILYTKQIGHYFEPKL